MESENHLTAGERRLCGGTELAAINSNGRHLRVLTLRLCRNLSGRELLQLSRHQPSTVMHFIHFSELVYFIFGLCKTHLIASNYNKRNLCNLTLCKVSESQRTHSLLLYIFFQKNNRLKLFVARAETERLTKHSSRILVCVKQSYLIHLRVCNNLIPE